MVLCHRREQSQAIEDGPRVLKGIAVENRLNQQLRPAHDGLKTHPS